MGQTWLLNEADQARKALERLNLQPQQQGEQQVARVDLSQQWREAFKQLQAAALPQVQDAPFDGPSTNVAIGIGGGSGGTFAGRAGRRVLRPSGAETGGGEEFADADDAEYDAYSHRAVVLPPRPTAAATAGLMSLPVTVPTTGEVYRFQKRNGGAELTVAVSGTGTGRRWTRSGTGWARCDPTPGGM